jgi:hypothetical protein
VITASNVYGYSFRTKFYSMSKNVIDNVVDLVPVVFVKHPGRLINNLNQITGTGYSRKLPLERTA